MELPDDLTSSNTFDILCILLMLQKIGLGIKSICLTDFISNVGFSLLYTSHECSLYVF